jgi:hypothetical protein
VNLKKSRVILWTSLETRTVPGWARVCMREARLTVSPQHAAHWAPHEWIYWVLA